MSKLIITRINGKILTVLHDGRRPVQIDLEETSGSILGNIYVGKVQNLVKNINAAFVDIGNGVTGYYSLEENRRHLFTNQAGHSHPAYESSPACLSAAGARGFETRALASGDEIIVQVSRDAVKTKAPVLTGNLNLTGRYCVLTVNKPHISFSSRIHDVKWKQQTAAVLKPEVEPEFGLIVRTNAYDSPQERLLEELRTLRSQYHKILKEGRFRAGCSLLMEAEPPYIARLRDTYSGDVDEIITDDADILNAVREYLAKEQPENAGKIRLYQDPLVTLVKLYSLEKAVDDALQKKVWLKSGGYLVIEYTEAMTVIDVNTGKYSGKKNVEDTLFKINLEAAEEIALQLRLRNLSGIIVVDFIDMESADSRRELMGFLTAQCAKDPVKTTVVDMTKLGLVEITRKKVRRPFHEQYRGGST